MYRGLARLQILGRVVVLIVTWRPTTATVLLASVTAADLIGHTCGYALSCVTVKEQDVCRLRCVLTRILSRHTTTNFKQTDPERQILTLLNTVTSKQTCTSYSCPHEARHAPLQRQNHLPTRSAGDARPCRKPPSETTRKSIDGRWIKFNGECTESGIGIGPDCGKTACGSCCEAPRPTSCF